MKAQIDRGSNSALQDTKKREKDYPVPIATADVRGHGANVTKATFATTCAASLYFQGEIIPRENHGEISEHTADDNLFNRREGNFSSLVRMYIV